MNYTFIVAKPTRFNKRTTCNAVLQARWLVYPFRKKKPEPEERRVQLWTTVTLTIRPQPPQLEGCWRSSVMPTYNFLRLTA